MIEFWNNSKKKNPSNVSKKGKQKITPIPGIEPGSQHGECRVIAITLYRTFYEMLYNQPCSLSDLQGLVLLVVYYLGGCAPSWH